MNTEPLKQHPPAAMPANALNYAPKRRHSAAGLWIAALVVILILAGLGYAAYWIYRTTATATAVTGKAGRGSMGPVPVIAVASHTGDMPILLNGLGTVTALNTVTVHTRVDGQLMKVAYTEGQIVQAGDTLVEIDPRPFQVQLTQAQGQLARDQATLTNDKLNLDRYQSAAEAVSAQQIATAQAAVGQDEGAVKADQAMIDSANLNLTYCHITAPITGRVGLRLVDQGNIVHASDATGLVVITQLNPISVVFSLSEDDLPQVLKGMKSGEGLTAEAYDRDFTAKLATGKLLAVDNQIDPTTGTVKFKAHFENEAQMLFPNQFVNIRLLVDTLKNVMLVPTAAIQKSPQNIFVYVVGNDDTVEIQPVTPGPSEGDTTAIEEGLTDGQVVVTDGVDKLLPKSKVVVTRGDLGTTTAASGPAPHKGPGTRRSK